MIDTTTAVVIWAASYVCGVGSAFIFATMLLQKLQWRRPRPNASHFPLTRIALARFFVLVGSAAYPQPDRGTRSNFDLMSAHLKIKFDAMKSFRGKEVGR